MLRLKTKAAVPKIPVHTWFHEQKWPNKGTLAVSSGLLSYILQNRSEASIQALLSRDEGVSSHFLCQLYILIAHTDAAHYAPAPHTYSGIPWLYCVSEDTTCNILRTRKRIHGDPLWLVQIIPFGQKERKTRRFPPETSKEEEEPQTEAVFVSVEVDTRGVHSAIRFGYTGRNSKYTEIFKDQLLFNK